MQVTRRASSYQSQISRSTPTAFLFLIDQSGSMSDKMAGTGHSKSEFVADVINRTLMNLITTCTKADGVRDYFHVGAIGYGEKVQNALWGALSQEVLHPISQLEQHPLRVEDRIKKVSDGAGGLVDTKIKFPVWVDAVASLGTPMRAALTCAAENLVKWCDRFPDSYPPTILHVTDGESTDGDPEQHAEAIRQIGTRDGGLLLFNLHVSVSGSNPVRFPAAEAGLPDKFAKLLFRMSSPLPSHLHSALQNGANAPAAGARGFMFNAGAADLVEFFDIGTRPSQLR